jgi:hypothetical protein
MFKKAIFCTTIATIAAILGWTFFLAFPAPSDIKKYRLMKDAGKVTVATNPKQDSRQYRSGVRKDLWLSQPDQGRLHYRIDSASSTLTLIPEGDKFDIFENLHHLHCWMQDKLYTQGETLMQQVRFFIADEGVYRFSSQQFTAQKVELALFRVPGNSLFTALDPKSAFMRGVAKGVSFAIAGNTPKFQAEHFKAQLIGQGEQP